MPSSEPAHAPDPGGFSDFYENGPCGFLALEPDGTILTANATLLRFIGRSRAEVEGRRRLQDLLAPGSRIYQATHWGPVLELQGWIREIPADLLGPGGARLPVLLSADLERTSDGRPAVIRMSLLDASDRRRYEQELIAARDVERAARVRVERLQRLGMALSSALQPADVAAAVLAEIVDAGDAAFGRVVLGTAAADVLLERGSRPEGEEPTDAPLRLSLLAEEVPIGVLELTSARPGPVSAEQRAFLEACAVQCAQAMRRAQLFAELERRSAQQAVLFDVGGRALEAGGLEPLLTYAADRVLHTLQADAVRISPRRAVAQRPGDAASGPPSAQTWSTVTRARTPGHEREHASSTVAIGPVGEEGGTLALHMPGSRPLSGGEAAFLTSVAHVLWTTLERHRLDAVAQHQARHDLVTGLPNRRLLEERLHAEAVRSAGAGTRFLVCLLDLDDFKLVNDTLGHQAGDQLLAAVAARLSGGVPEADLVARLGGDEFVVVGGDVADGHEQELPERIHRTLLAPFTLLGRDYAIRASIGWVLGGPDTTPGDLIRDADVAMYRAKEAGGSGHVRFEAPMLDRGRDRLLMKRELRTALTDGQLHVRYQPIVRASDERLLGLEALVRWRHPVRGLISPGAFIPIAESTGVIPELGEFVLNEALRQLARWRHEGVVAPDVTIAVNVSGLQLLQTDFVAHVRDALTRNGFADTPQLLALEITESVLMEGNVTAARVLDALSQVGVGLHLDDFGTGASSLSRLRGFPVSTLKIDRSFVADVGRGDTEDEAVVGAILAMGNALGLEVVAEGVETVDQHRRLRDMGCQRLQGYLFAAPLEAADLQAHLRGGLGAVRVPHGAPR